MPPSFSKGDKEEESSLHYFTRIILAMKGERRENSYTTRAYNLSELVVPWPMSVSFLHRASDLFTAPNGGRDNYKRGLKRRNERHMMQSKQE
jgi:hypothetical protein